MKICNVVLKSVSPYGQGRHHETPRLAKENDSDYEARTWREKLNVGSDKETVVIPPMAFKNAVAEVAKYIGRQIPGKGKATFTKHFESGILVLDPVVLLNSNGQPIKKNDVVSERLYVPSNGQRGGGKRVWKIFPVIPSWEGKVDFYVLDDTITESVFVEHLKEAGNFIGVGRFRPRNNGFYGRFEVVKAQWSQRN